MAREINLTDIGDHFGDKVQKTVRKRNSWKSNIEPYVGIVSTNIEYAEPVAYGTNLPPSWGGQYRTRQQTIKGYPELIAKQLEQFIRDEFRRS